MPQQTVDTPVDRDRTVVHDAALMRMRKLNARHGTLALDLRNKPDALGPHAVALLYLTTGPTGAREVVAAWRLFRDADDVRNLPNLLSELTRAASAKLVSDGPYDPPMHLAHRYDRMPADAPFIGIGVSSLDTPTGGRWVDVRDTRHLSALDIVGRSRIVLKDGARLMLDRGGELGNMGHTYTDRGADNPTHVINPYRTLEIPPAEQPIWSLMSQFGGTVANVYRQLAADRAARGVPRQRRGSTTHRADR